MPEGYDITRTFDLLFKIYKIFDLDFDGNVKNAMHFIQYYIYKMKERHVKMTPRMEDIYNRVSREIPFVGNDDI